MPGNGIEDTVLAIRDLSQEKRLMLWSRASRRADRSKWLHMLTGVLALLSGGTITAVLSGHLSHEEMQAVAAILAFSSGILSLLTTTIYDTKDTNRMFDGAARYAQLRDKAQVLNDQLSSMSDNRCRDMLKDLRTESLRLGGEFDRLLSVHEVNSLRAGSFGVIAALGDE